MTSRRNQNLRGMRFDLLGLINAKAKHRARSNARHSAIIDRGDNGKNGKGRSKMKSPADKNPLSLWARKYFIGC
jgi:hypothetical protein